MASPFTLPVWMLNMEEEWSEIPERSYPIKGARTVLLLRYLPSGAWHLWVSARCFKGVWPVLSPSLSQWAWPFLISMAVTLPCLSGHDAFPSRWARPSPSQWAWSIGQDRSLSLAEVFSFPFLTSVGGSLPYCLHLGGCMVV